jgi:two-component system, OmpR family, phosphate regulon sensor histidine kinase PhoR
MTLIYLLCFCLGLLISWAISYAIFSRKIRMQTRKMVQLMKADELKLDRPADVFQDDDGHFFSDLERASYTLRRKYLRLKKNTADERAVFETIFSGLNEAVVTIDPDLRIISFNTAFMKQFKWAPASSTANYFLQDVIREPEILETFKQVFSSANADTKNVGEYQLFASLLPSVEDHKTWALGVFYDMSEIQKTEKIRVDFVANASHELRTPLTVIRGYADLLNTNLQKENSPLTELSKPIVESAHNMTLLLNDLLNLSRLDNINKIEKVKLSTKEVTAEILGELEPIISMNNKKVICYFSEEFVFADYSSLTQVLRNLIVNAIRYSGHEPGSEVVEVRWNSVGSVTQLIVKDRGPGIAKEHQSRIFERFYRVDKGRNRNQGGSGLGLALVKHHTQIHGGQISLRSDLGEGCEFVCEFPSGV